MGRVSWTMRDALVSVLLVLVLGTFAVSAISVERETNNRVKCASNLKLFGSALLLYSNENRNAYPRTIADVTSGPTWGTPYEGNDRLAAVANATPFAKEDGPVAQTRVKPNDVTASLFLLLRTQDLSSDTAICPSSGRKAWDFGGRDATALDWTNWRGKAGLKAHLSYSYANPFPTVAATRAGYKLNNSLAADFAVAADMNPGGADVLKATPRAGVAALRAANSMNHGRDGQNVLFGDGHVEFVQSPIVGGAKDNIYTYGVTTRDSGGDGVSGSPVSATDAILLPTAHDIGLTEGEIGESTRPGPKLLSAAEEKLLKDRIAGKYGRPGTAGLVLEITADRVVAKKGPLALSFDYEVRGVLDDTVHATLKAEGVDPAEATFTPTDGGLRVRAPYDLSGDWAKQN